MLFFEDPLRITSAILIARSGGVDPAAVFAQLGLRFFEEAASRFGGRDVWVNAVWSIAFEMAETGLARGYRDVFGAGSFLISSRLALTALPPKTGHFSKTAKSVPSGATSML